ncbi:MAG: hypothetical protein Q4C06_06965 [Bacillota bacterium]|nr:hypothetical protein [Bacillota bacterium]
MSNITLEEKIKNLSADYIYQQAAGSLLLLLMSAMEDVEKGDTALPYEVPEDIKALKNKVTEYLLSLEEILNGSADDRIDALNDCMGLKKQLLHMYETVYSYFSQWNIISTLVSDQVALRKYKEDGISQKQVEWSLFFADCHAFMESAETLLDQKNYMGQLLKCIPLYMTRDKYYDMVYASLSAAFAGESKEFIDVSLKAFEGFCSPQENPLYGKYFPEIAEWIGQKQMVLPHKMDDEALSEYYEELKEMFEVMEQIEEYFSCILHDINSLILILYLSYTFEDLTEGSASHADLYHAVCEFIEGELDETEKAAYLETLVEQLEAAVEPVIDKANAIGKEEYELLQKAGSFAGFSEDTNKVLMTEEFIRECFFGDLNDELFRFHIPEDLPPATEEEKKTLFQAFITKTRNHFDTLPAQTRKLAMQNLTGALPPVYSVHDVMDMLTEAIDKASSEEQKVLIVDKAGMVFNAHGWTSITDGHADHHHHDHDCDCGCHDHHHRHDCGCGHDHHDHHHHH